MDGKSEWVRHVNVTLGGVPQMWTLKNGRKLLSFFCHHIYCQILFPSSVVAILSSLKSPSLLLSSSLLVLPSSALIYVGRGQGDEGVGLGTK